MTEIQHGFHDFNDFIRWYFNSDWKRLENDEEGFRAAVDMWNRMNRRGKYREIEPEGRGPEIG